MKKLILVLMIMLSACTSTTNYENTLQPWIGRSEGNLYQAWGNPASEFYVTPDTKVVTYIQTENKPIDGNTQPYAGVDVDYQAIETPNYGEQLSNNNNNNYFCKTSFTITNGAVVNYTFNGDDCIARN